ncbi:MAG TPA: alpha/beta fold hydrolase [Micromonospora sp.]
MTNQSDLWIRRLHPELRSGPRLVCFPHAGGSATFFQPLARHAPSLDVVGVQYPGRQDRRAEPCLDDIAALADQVSAGLAPWTDRPLVFFGHSMGAVVGYEVARRFQRERTGVPIGLVASGRCAPSIQCGGDVHTRDDRGVVAEIRRLSGTAASLLDDDEIVQMILPATRADYKAVETYRHGPGPRLTCPITAMTGDADPRVTIDEARAWADHTSGPFDLRKFPGGHFYLSDDWAAVGRAVTECVTAFSAGPAVATD